MKKLPLAMMLGLLACLTQAANIDGYHTFSSADGKTIDGKIIEYDRDQNLLKIERRNGKSAWVAPGAFSETDRSYILEWIEADKILSERSLSVSLEKKTQSAGADADFVSYEIKLWNQSGGPIDGLKIEYRFLVELSSSGLTVPDPKRVVSGDVNVDHVDDESGIKLKTRSVREFQQFTQSSKWKSYDNHGNEIITINKPNLLGTCSIRGVLIRIHGPSIDGVPTHRDLCDPESLDGLVSWDEKLPSLNDDFRFQDIMGPPKAEKNVMSLENVKERGRAKTSQEYNEWMQLLFGQFRLDLSVEEQHQLIEGLKFFYDPDRDSRGSGASFAGSKCWKNGWLAEAAEWYEIALEIRKRVDEKDEYHNGSYGRAGGTRKDLILIYACSKDPQARNGPKAVEYAGILLEYDKKDPILLDLMARAYAANSQFDLAVKTQKYSIERFQKTIGKRSDLEKFKNRLKLYQNKQPYLEDAL